MKHSDPPEPRTDREARPPPGADLAADLLEVPAARTEPAGIRRAEPIAVPAGRSRPRVGEYELIAQLPSSSPLEVFVGFRMSRFGFVHRAVVKRAARTRGDHATARRRIFEEARALAFLSHTNLPLLLDIGEDESCTYLAREHFDGIDLAGINTKLRTRGEALPFELACYMVAEVLRALHHAHTATAPDGRPLDVLHLNLQPASVLVGRSGYLKLIDLGQGSLRERPADPQASPALRPELAYLAPELVQGKPGDFRADVYSAGVLLFELLTGRPCFRGRTVQDVLQKIARCELRLERLDEEGVPLELRRLVERATHPTPGRRFGSAAEMANALETWLMQAGLHAGAWILAAFCVQHELIDSQELVTRNPLPAPSPEPLRLPSQAPASLPPAPAFQAGFDDLPDLTEDAVTLRGESVVPQGTFATLLRGEPPERGSVPPPPAEPTEPRASLAAAAAPREIPIAAPGRPPLPSVPPPPPPPPEGRITLPPVAPVVAAPPSFSSPPMAAPSAPPLRPATMPPLPPPGVPSYAPYPARTSAIPPADTAPFTRPSMPPMPPPAQTTKPSQAPLRSAPPRPPIEDRGLVPDDLDGFGDPFQRSSESRTQPMIPTPGKKSSLPAEAVRSAKPRPATEPERPGAADLPPPPAPLVPAWSGDLSVTRTAEVVSRLVQLRASGTLELRAGPIWKKLLLSDGSAVALQSNVGMESIGEQLVRAKLIQRYDLDRALRESLRGEDGVADRLLDVGAIDAPRLGAELGKSVADGLVDAFGWRQGSFDFQPAAIERPRVMPQVEIDEIAQRELSRGKGARTTPPEGTGRPSLDPPGRSSLIDALGDPSGRRRR